LSLFDLSILSAALLQV